MASCFPCFILNNLKHIFIFSFNIIWVILYNLCLLLDFIEWLLHSVSNSPKIITKGPELFHKVCSILSGPFCFRIFRLTKRFWIQFIKFWNDVFLAFVLKVFSNFFGIISMHSNLLQKLLILLSCPCYFSFQLSLFS